MPKSFSRRSFLKGVAAASMTLGLNAPAVLAQKNPNSKLNIAVVGVGGRGGENINELKLNPTTEKFFAFCDVNSNTLAAQSDRFKVEHRYKDYRVLLDKHAKELDGVLVATMDHTHGIIACSVMELGLNCYCEKPLANTVWEIRQMARWAANGGAKAKRICTQTGTQVRSWGTGNNAHYYRSIELLRSGAIGTVTEVHNWVDGTYVPKTDPVGESPVPDYLDYDLWLGPTPHIPYNEQWLTFSKYGFWHSGCGWITGMGPHTLDLIWTALDLIPPYAIEADTPKPPSKWYNRDQAHITFIHSTKGMKRMPVHWYDGKRRPEGIDPARFDAGKKSAVLFVGTEGSLQVHYGYHTLFPKEKFAGFTPPEPTYPQSIGHQRQWLEAIRQGKPELCECGFEYASHYMEAINLAAMMHRESVEKVEWNSKTMTTNSEAVNKRLKPVFRDGWKFPVV